MTINPSQRIIQVKPSADGIRHFDFQDGDFPLVPASLLYENVLDGNPTNSIDPAYGNIGIFPDQSDIVLLPKSISPSGLDGNFDGPDMFVVADPDNPGNSVLKIIMDAGVDGENYEPGPNPRHRALLQLAAHLDNDLTGSHTTGALQFRIVPDVEYWFGFKFRINITGGNIGNNWFLFTPIAETVGEPVVYVKGGDGSKLVISPERYKDENGNTQETSKTIVGDFAVDTWHTMVIRWIKKPYSVGTATSYIADTVGGTKAGVFEVWVDDVKLNGSRGEANPAYTGTDREGRLEENARPRIGIYWGDQDYEGVTANVFFDQIRIAEGANQYDNVVPS